MVRQFINLFKLRIGVVITLAALGGMAITPGQALTSWQVLVLSLAVMLASAAAGAFNQYFECDIDAKMDRTHNRPFVSGFFQHSRKWLVIIGVMLAIAVSSAAFAFNAMTALNIFLGAFTYAIVYTAWLKRRTWLNIVFGGLAGSFAVLAGAAAVDPSFGPLPGLLALVLFLWTPPHFWSLAIVIRDQYAAAGVPMLPVVKGDKKAARIILGHTILLVLVSLAPVYYGLGWIYFTGALIGGAYFLVKSVQLVRNPTKQAAMANFIASLVQFSVLMIALMLEVNFGT
ncbi:MAG: protoheme IX farnesyltransferase [Gallionellales bacterium RIFCSPLOWO2_12_FULL_59_22]|nr:MAG: protoheme IX farnesyltransferase [Gallionellales bacterium RIFCSPLOWO2_02_FULL_59_110]OGT04503.1 MAG: protoheme IX farnesyltransferase [Gallionellales bacterium RIFCSPLOWO2_02_58_13]OGT13509.1 MAG: protoheme IX farnesyltransferase [Gallionellales bacterium RIFCSPLOWO2_12_FULL_59_22]